MKWASAGLTFVNVATVSSLLLGIAFSGLSRTIALISILLALGVAVFAFLKTRERQIGGGDDAAPLPEPTARTERVFFWLLLTCFGFFAFRSFCWLLYIDGNELKVQSPNNLGDLSLHLAYIRNFANGVPLWPDNPIHVFSKMRYPAGIDLFNALLVLLGVDLRQGLIWIGLLGSAATFFALYRWGGAFGVAGFLFNGGVAGFQVLQTFQFLDYQGDKSIAWKNLRLSMFVTQRGLLYGLPAGLLLLYQWRAKYFTAPQGAALSARPTAEKRGDLEGAAPCAPLPFWLELMLYATLPLFHLHTFMALSIVAALFFAMGDAAARRQLGTLVAAAFLPATLFVWTISDHLRARSLLQWKPGWVQTSGSDMAAPFFHFWFVNFGILIPLVLLLIGVCVWRAARSEERFSFRAHPALAWLAPPVVLFAFAWLVKTAPWEWDNIKLMIWAYLMILPLLWRELIVRWPVPVRVGICVALFTSGFVSLLGGLTNKENGYGLIDRAELDAVGWAVRKLPVQARFAAFPTYNHPLLLQGRNVVLGYPGHLWTQGFHYIEIEKQLRTLMQGSPEWKETARQLDARYLFWGREETTAYPGSTRPWEREGPPVDAGSWGAIYDLAPEMAH
ncbi:MAG: hypothetical protein ABR589_07895 [Chthoniobacterales bacterium]